MIKKLTNFINHHLYRPLIVKNKTKLFCIGMNKTGTTSLKKAFEDLGYIVGNQRVAERLLPNYLNGDVKPIIRYCNSAQVFQDIPFSLPNTYKILDRAYPKAKFILTIRDNPEKWYNSITKYHALIFGDGELPTLEQLKNSKYVYKGFAWDAQKAICNPPEKNPYRKDVLINSYQSYNAAVKEYFKTRKSDLLIINVSEKESYQKLIDFLGITSPFDDFPWENKTIDIQKNK